MQKKSSVLNVTKILVNFSFFVLVIIIVGSLLTSILSEEFSQGVLVVPMVLTILIGGLIWAILFQLRKIIVSVENNEPFCEANIKRFKNIGYIILFMGGIDVTVNFPVNNGNAIIATSNYSISASVFVFIVLGFLALLMSEIFAKAVEIKNENDMTI